MAEEKSNTSQDRLLDGRVSAPVNKAIEFGQAPPSLNTAGQLFQGGKAPPSLNLGGQMIKGMVPQSLAKIPLDQISQPSQSSNGGSNAPKESSSNSGVEQSSSSGK
jgi:hypothetical protein